MTKFNILSGDFLYGTGFLKSGYLHIETALYPWPGITLGVEELSGISAVNEERTVNTKSALTLGLAGALAGPLGVAAGLAMADEEVEITFLAQLHDGRSILGVAGIGAYRELESAVAKALVVRAHRSYVE